MTYVIPLILLGYVIQAQNENFEMTQIGLNYLLEKPWDLHYGQDGSLWVTEGVAGVLVRINPTTAERDELINI